MAIKPSSKNSIRRSLRKTPASSMARTCGASRSRAKRRTEAWNRRFFFTQQAEWRHKIGRCHYNDEGHKDAANPQHYLPLWFPRRGDRLRPVHARTGSEGNAQSSHSGGLGRAREVAGLHRRLGDSTRRRSRSRRSWCARCCRRSRSRGRPWSSHGRAPRAYSGVCGESGGGSAPRHKDGGQPDCELLAAGNARNHGPALSDRSPDDAGPGDDGDRSLHPGTPHLYETAPCPRIPIRASTAPR